MIKELEWLKRLGEEIENIIGEALKIEEDIELDVIEIKEQYIDVEMHIDSICTWFRVDEEEVEIELGEDNYCKLTATNLWGHLYVNK